MWAVRKHRWLLACFVPRNLLMIVATPTVGARYLIDLLGAALVAIASICATHALRQRLHDGRQQRLSVSDSSGAVAASNLRTMPGCCVMRGARVGRRATFVLVRASCLIGVILSTPVLVPLALAQPLNACEQAGQAAEQKFGVPSGMLLAIGRVESGRYDAGLGRVAPHPWTINVDGAPQWFDGSAEAVLTDAGGAGQRRA